MANKFAYIYKTFDARKGDDAQTLSHVPRDDRAEMLDWMARAKPGDFFQGTDYVVICQEVL